MNDAIINLKRNNDVFDIHAKGDGESLVFTLIEGTAELLPRIGMPLESYISCLTQYAEPRLMDAEAAP